jgi:hypothetical protein
VLALFGHEYAFADPEVGAAVNAVYERYAPELRDDPTQHLTHAWPPPELTGSSLFTGVEARWFQAVVPYPTRRYRRLLCTFSRHRMLPAPRRDLLHDAIEAVVDGYGGVLRQRLDTVLVLGRRAGERARRAG